VLMGLRLYSPASGGFLSVDPVYGGSSNSYDYCSADSISCSDGTGKGKLDCNTWSGFLWLNILKPFGIVYNRSKYTVLVADNPEELFAQPTTFAILLPGQDSRHAYGGYYIKDVDAYKVLSSKPRPKYISLGWKFTYACAPNGWLGSGGGQRPSTA